MAITLEAQAQQSLIIVREAPSLKKLATPEGWPAEHVATDDELLSAIRRAHNAGRRFIVVAMEADFGHTMTVLRQRAGGETMARGGIVVVAKEPEAFLLTHGADPELLEVAAEKDLKKNVEIAALRAVRALVRAEEGGNLKGGYQALERLNEVFIELSAERNPQRLLATCLVKAMDLTQAEGGTLYMVHEKDGEMYFRVKISNDRSNEVTFQHTTLKVVENSICGYVALTGKLLNIPELAGLRPLSLPQFHKSLDHSHPDKTISLLTLPFKNSRNEIIAILQLINKREDGVSVVPFHAEDESLLASFATQAAVCMENVDLYADIQRLFEGFVKASISAIESRDPSTGGHSERVAKICVALARATTECNVGIYRSVRFREEEIRELEYAALLHDFGKIGVREEVLVKAKKLYPFQLEAIKERIKICKAAAKIQYLEKRLKGGNETHHERDYQERLRQLESYWEIVLAANEPSVLKKENREVLERIRAEQLLLPDNSRIALVTEDEYQALAVSQGSLTDSERLEIESHVRHTYQFLKMIPWTKDFRHLTEIAYCHHEKLDGSGYPRGLTSHEIPLQSKIMTIADIYDALTAADRWYKEAVPVEKALDILRNEVNQGKMDPVLFELFVEKKIYELTQPKILNQVA